MTLDRKRLTGFWDVPSIQKRGTFLVPEAVYHLRTYAWDYRIGMQRLSSQRGGGWGWQSSHSIHDRKRYLQFPLRNPIFVWDSSHGWRE